MGSTHMDAFRDTNVILARSSSASVLITIVAWGYFRYRAGKTPDDPAVAEG